MLQQKTGSGPTLPLLFQELASTRQMMSLMEKEFLAGSGAFVFDKADWVRLWYDPEHAIRSDCGTMTAYRAITVGGQLLWYVFTDGKTRGFHAIETDPFAAMEAADRALARRKMIRADHWDRIETVASDLRNGRQKFSVSLDDAHRSPLCTLGIEGFMQSVGLGRVQQINGRLAGFLFKIEPQVGFVIHEAWLRALDQEAPLTQTEAQIAG